MSGVNEYLAIACQLIYENYVVPEEERVFTDRIWMCCLPLKR